MSSIMLKVMAGDTINISAKAFYNIDKTLPGQSANILPVLGGAVAAMANPSETIAGEAVQLAADLGTTVSQSTALTQVPKDDDGRDKSPQPIAGINFVLYNDNFEIVEENTGTIVAEDQINKIQTLASDMMVMRESGFLEVYANNDAQTPVYFDNLMVLQSTGSVKEVNAYYPYGMLIGALSTAAAGDEYNAYKYNGKELQDKMGLNWLDYGARMQDPIVGRWWVPDPLAEMYYSTSPYMYVLGNPINNFDPNGLSTHTDSTGRVVAVYNDEDLNVYKHDVLPEEYATYDGQTVTEYSYEDGNLVERNLNRLSGGKVMGETEHWDEFRGHSETTGAILNTVEGTIMFGEIWDYAIDLLNRQANTMNLDQVALHSLEFGIFDIKRSLTFSPYGIGTGKLLNGKYASARSAGNYLAGMNGATGTTLAGLRLTRNDYMRMAGLIHAITHKTNPFKAPFYGEIPYAGRMIDAGFNAGVKKR